MEAVESPLENPSLAIISVSPAIPAVAAIAFIPGTTHSRPEQVIATVPQSESLFSTDRIGREVPKLNRAMQPYMAAAL